MSRLKHLLDKLAVATDDRLSTAQCWLSTAQLMLTNNDLRPVEPKFRQWTRFNFVALWASDSLNLIFPMFNYRFKKKVNDQEQNTWMITSSMIYDGLSWWQSWICVWLGNFIAACFVCLMGRIGAVYHIPFAVANRASFGVWGSLWPVFTRCVMAVIWYGVQTYLGGECVTLMIQAIWPSYANLPDTLPLVAGVTTKDFVSFFLFWLLSLPALWVPIHKIRHLFTVKTCYSPAAAVGFFIWAIIRAEGLGNILKQPNTVYGSTLAWVIIRSIIQTLGNFAALIINNPDFSRFAEKPEDTFWTQLVTIPVAFALTSFVGTIVSSSSSVVYGQATWNPLALLQKFLEGASSAERFGVFTIASGFALAQLGTNVAANSVSGGTNIAALLPRFINIRRGGYICATISLTVCPWKIISSPAEFNIFLSAVSMFLSAIIGVVISDYYFVRRGYLDVRELYSARKDGPYYGFYGISWHAYFAYIFGISINVVGFAGVLGAKVPVGAQYVYDINFFSGFIVSAGTYWILTRIFPISAMSERWNQEESGPMCCA